MEREDELKLKLQDLQKQLGKKQMFEDAVTSIRSLLHQFYLSSSPSLRKLFFTVISRVATILKTRYTSPGFWNAGLGLFLEAEQLTSDSSEKQHLKTYIARAREQLSEIENQPEESAQNRRNQGPHIPTVLNADGNATIILSADQFSENDKKLIERDCKAFGAITMALPNDVIHNFKECKTTKELWDALELRFEGCAELIESRVDNWKRQFELFEYLSGETLNDQINRFTMLVSNLKNAGVEFKRGDICKKLLSALPHKWNVQVMVIKRTNNLNTMTLEDLIGLLQSYEVDMQSNSAKEAKSTGFGHTLVSNTNIIYSNTPAASQAMPYIPPTQSNVQFVQASYPSTPTAQNFQSSASNISGIPEEKSILYHAFLSSYEAYMAGNLVSAEFEREDLEQVSPDDLEEMDIQWQMAMLTIRAKRFFKRTGRNNFRRGEGKVGFDKTKAQCYNCDGFGHFARECNAPQRARQFNTGGGNGANVGNGAGNMVGGNVQRNTHAGNQLVISNGTAAGAHGTENQAVVATIANVNIAIITQEYDWSMDESLFVNTTLMADAEETISTPDQEIF